MVTKEQIEEIAREICLVIDNPQSVRRQLQKLNLVQRRLAILKRELRQILAESKSDNGQPIPNSVIRAGLAFLPPNSRKWGHVAQAGIRDVLKAKQKAENRPYLELQQLIDIHLGEIEKLRLQAQEYLFNKS